MVTTATLEADMVERLRSFLASPSRPEDTFSYNELAGFLFAIACSPELVPPSDWLPLVFANEEANYRDLDEAQSINHAIMELHNGVNQEVIEGTVQLPPGCKPVEGALSNFASSSPVGEWSRGFLHGHSYLEEVWGEYVPEDLDEELGSCLMVLSFFADRKLAEAYYEEAFSGEQSLEQLAEEVLTIFKEAMGSYAHIGRSIYQALLEFHSDECEFAAGVKLEAGDSCPCDSGKQFKDCCGGNKTVH